ncbi:hypothetical protein P4N68_09645 [Corynebacterium felinum]|uniref:Membrane protein n=1 Tax=Corynebacterium felinum TaxID=131318 RepID=A0ABU2BB87_9CORY|nr:hypothetical protein [Corynebacterium felinum]MDF5821339.1 hypothetical protein [Corynebacterium felinum]MDR7355863.1 putative membrane protein [Corynebacterium felinum]WJY95206.1 hypothetical protein CFELI_08000 [Corynebacterium felinum]
MSDDQNRNNGMPSQPEDRPAHNQDNSDSTFGYGPTNHPEDHTGFGTQPPTYPTYPTGEDQGHYGSYGHGYDVGYSDPHAMNAGHSGQLDELNRYTNTRMVTRSQGADFMMAINYGFKATFAKPLFWLGTTAIIIIITMIIGLIVFFSNPLFGASLDPTNMDPETLALLQDQSKLDVGQALGSSFATIIMMSIVTPFFVGASLAQIDNKDLNWKSITESANMPVSFLAAFFVMLLTQLPTTFIQLALYKEPEFDPDTGLPLMGGFSAFMPSFVSFLWAIFVAILFTIAVHLVADRRETSVGSIGASAQIVGRNYFQFFFGSLAVSIILGFGTVLTCFIGSIVFLPMMFNYQAHLYRQAAQGRYPEM